MLTARIIGPFPAAGSFRTDEVGGLPFSYNFAVSGFSPFELSHRLHGPTSDESDVIKLLFWLKLEVFCKVCVSQLTRPWAFSFPRHASSCSSSSSSSSSTASSGNWLSLPNVPLENAGAETYRFNNNTPTLLYFNFNQYWLCAGEASNSNEILKYLSYSPINKYQSEKHYSF